MTRVAGGLIGVVFGVVLSWSAMSDPSVVRSALLFERAYMFLFFASAVFVAVTGVRLLRRHQRRALLTGGPIGWDEHQRPERRHYTGALVFGLGWGLTGACPGPIATQLGQGIAWGIPIVLGVIGGVYLFLRQGDPETEPPADQPAVTPRPVPVT